MQRVCFLLQVRPEKLAEYKERHKDVWPEMKEALTECGWRNYSLFLRPDGLLVGYLETDNFALAKARMEERDVNARWQRDMAPFFAEAGGVGDGTGFRELREVFHLD
jgi:L-rhamnose mutarotase